MADASFGPDIEDSSFYADTTDTSISKSCDLDLSFGDDLVQPSTPPSDGIVGAGVDPEDLQA
jgi:hypothetical protein